MGLELNVYVTLFSFNGALHNAYTCTYSLANTSSSIEFYIMIHLEASNEVYIWKTNNV